MGEDRVHAALPRDIAALGAVLVPLCALYAATTSPYVLGEDNGEFCALYAAGGVAHPSGYPLYTLLLRAFRWLPASSPARGAALVTAAIGLGAVALLYGACRAWGASPAGAALGAVMYGTAPLAWDLSTKAEVFALNSALAAAIMLVGAPEAPLAGVARAGALGLLLGLGLSNHHSVVLLAPLVVWAALAARRETPRRGSATLALAGGVLAGLTPYASLPFAAHAGGGAWVWGDMTSLNGLVHHFLRRDFGTTRLAVGPSQPSIAGNLELLARTLFVELRGVGFVVGLAALAALAVTAARAARGGSTRHFAFTALAASFLLAGPGFAALVNVDPTPEGVAIVRRFHLMPLLLLCVPLALGADVVLRRVRVPFRVAVVATALAAGALLGFGAVRTEHGAMLQSYVVDSLDTAPENAVVLGSGDVRVFGTLYAQLGLGVRRDVVFVSPILLHYDWYRKRVGTVLGFAVPPPANGSVDTVALASAVLGAGRRLFLTDVFSDAIPRAFPTYPLGTLIEVLPRGAPVPSPAELEQENLAVFARYHVDARVLDPARAWSRGARDAYARPWSALAAAFRARGDEAAANLNARRATLVDWIDGRS